MGQDTSSLKPHIQLSIITCDAGEEIYSIWGHTAVRVVDSVNQTDIVFNYGTFDFNEPNFLAKFIKGNLLYFVSANNYNDFIAEYKLEQRQVIEQVLKLSATEKIKWYDALKINMLPANRAYLYNFITDNCTTRIKDGLFKNSAFQPVGIHVPSFRYEVVKAPLEQGLPWIGLGIDLLLGAYSDQKPSDFQAAFLPNLLHEQIANTRKLVVANNTLVTVKQKNLNSPTPFLVLALGLFIYLLASKWNSLITQRLAKFFDITLLFTFSLGGALLFYMSFVSKHTACYENYNIMWLHPLYLIALVFYFVKNKIIGKIGLVFFASTIALIITSYWLPQHFSKEVWILMATALLLNYRLIEKGRINSLFK
jgi:hypothetical protein